MMNNLLDVLYEDDDLIFVNKPPRMVVQRGYDQSEPLLIDIVNEHVGRPVYLLQRLDRGTTGVIFFSKTAEYNVRLTRQFERKRIRKRYCALCEGEVAQNETIDAPIARVGAIKFAVRDDGKRAVTHVDPLASNRAASLLSITLETGRTHQIRVHLSAIGHPLIGDWLYGQRTEGRPMLHAAELELTHPRTNERLVVAAPLPLDFVEEAKRRGLALP